MTRTTRPSGFTVLELVLALALSLGIVMAAMAMMGLLYRADAVAAKRFDATTELAVAQIVIRRATQSMVSGMPEEEDEEDRATATPEEDSEANPDDDPEADPQDQSDEARQRRGEQREDRGTARDATIADAEGRTDDNDGSASWLDRLGEETPPDTRNHFDLFTEVTPEGFPVQKLELVLAKSPVPRSLADEQMIPPEVIIEEQLRDSVRGAFEIAARDDGWALQWTPIDPPGTPTVLVRALEACQWRVLPRRMKDDKGNTLPESNVWHESWAAYLGEDYPLAVELTIRTTRGAAVQWLFETGVTSPIE